MIYAIEKTFKGKSLGIVPNTGYEDKEKAENIKNYLQLVADNKGFNVKYKLVEV